MGWACRVRPRDSATGSFGVELKHQIESPLVRRGRQHPERLFQGGPEVERDRFNGELPRSQPKACWAVAGATATTLRRNTDMRTSSSPGETLVFRISTGTRPNLGSTGGAGGGSAGHDPGLRPIPVPGRRILAEAVAPARGREGVDPASGAVRPKYCKPPDAAVPEGPRFPRSPPEPGVVRPPVRQTRISPNQRIGSDPARTGYRMLPIGEGPWRS